MFSLHFVRRGLPPQIPLIYRRAAVGGEGYQGTVGVPLFA